MALNRYFFSFSLSPSIELRRANLLLTSRTLLDQRIQGYKEPKDIQNIRKLDNVFGFQPKRLYINCSASAKPENEDSSQKEDVHTLKASLRTMGVSSTPALTLTRRIIAAGLRSVIAIIITLFLTILGAPSLLSCKQGRSAALFLINTYIPGYMDVQSLSLGWTEPIRAEQISLKGVDEKLVLSIMKLETQASLWSLIRQKSGLGDCTIRNLWIDLQEDMQTGMPKLALALIPSSKLSTTSKKVALPMQAATKKAPSVDVALATTIKATGGDLNIIDGRITMRDDIAATLGQRVFIDIILGLPAFDNDHNLRQPNNEHLGGIPVKANMWSEVTQAEAKGLIYSSKQVVELMEPIKLEMDLSPAVAKLYLARINPLLGEIVGPAVQDEDMPDVVLCITPENMTIPAESYGITLEPMRAVLARGPLAGGILRLLSSGMQDVANGRKEVRFQTSFVQSRIRMDGCIECSRIDFLIAGKVAVATWGSIDLKDESLKMILAIPSATFINLLGLEISDGYYLKIPVGGTLQKPLVDWRAAAVGIAQLTARQRGGKLIKGLFSLLDSKEVIPEPMDAVPWVSKS